MKLMWKLLRQNVSKLQLFGYVFSGLVGLAIMLFAIQFYLDIRPIFRSNESFFKSDFIVINKKISTLSNFSANANTFGDKEIENLRKKTFVREVANFVSSKFEVKANTSNFVTQMFFEAVPDTYIDVDSRAWKTWSPDKDSIPVIIPRTYLALYNFGFAQSQGLPQLSENLITNIHLNVTITGNGKSKSFSGNIAGFSDKLNTILVPMSFMQWANAEFGNTKVNEIRPSRLLVQLNNPSDPEIASYFKEKDYEISDSKGDLGKASYFLRLVIIAVLIIGLIITLLAIWLMLMSVSLLIYKNKEKLENLTLLGYSRGSVTKPYQILSIALSVIIFVLAVIIVFVGRNLYIDKLSMLVNNFTPSSILVVLAIGLLILFVICAINVMWIRNKVNSIVK